MKRVLLLSMLFACSIMHVLAQTRTVSGKVKDETTGAPLPGVSVKIKGTAIGTATDANGSYSLSVSEKNDVLIFSFIGYLTQDKKITGLTSADVSLVTNSESLGEVVVTAYGTQTKANNTGAISAVKGKDVENVPFTSVDKILQGKVAGLQSTAASGQPGAVQQIRIRGIGSINGSSAPLFVVDGIPVNTGDLSRNTTTSNALAGINPNDIETVTVLKDAASSSIYGSRAGNGVILITTKSGGAGKTKIRVDGEYGSSKAILRSENRPLNTQEYRTLTAEGLFNAFPPGTPGGYPTLQDALADTDGSFNTGAGINTNWLDVVTRTGKQMQYNVSADGGNEKTQFHLSGGYFKQDGTVIASDFSRINTNLNIKHKVNERLSFGANMLISSSIQNSPTNGGTFANPVLAAYFLLPSYSPYKADGSPDYSSTDPDAYFGPNGSTFNPVAVAALDIHRSDFLKGLGSVNGEYKILPNLKITTKYGIDYNNIEEHGYSNPFYGDGFTAHGTATHYYTRYFNWVWTNLIDYTVDFKHNSDYVLNVKGGYEAQKSQEFQISSSINNLPGKASVTYGAAGATPVEATGNASDYAFASILGLADFSVKGKYVVSGSFRRDGSSRFGSENRYGNFWSVGASWNLDQEKFIKQFSFISQLKLRTSYGVNGNANFSGNGYDYAWRPLYGYGNGTFPDGSAYGYNYNGGGGSGPIAPGNAALTWEQNKPFDAGIDVSVFQGRLNATVEYYTRTTSHLLLNQPLSPTSGFTSYLNNIGSLRNKGIEIAISGTPVIAGDFRWDLNANFAHNKNEVLALVDKNPIIDGSFIRKIGSDYQTFYLRQWAGVDPANGDPLWYTDGTKATKTNSYTAATRAASGSASPKYFGSVGTTFSYKGFSVAGTFYYSAGNYVQDSWASYTQGDGYGGSFNKTVREMQRWQKPGDITNVPKYVYGGNKNSYRSSTRFLYKGDYIRLRDVTASYTLPQPIMNRLKFSSLRIYVRGTNLWTALKDKNLPYDPETGIASQTNLEVYIPKTYTVGINIGL